MNIKAIKYTVRSTGWALNRAPKTYVSCSGKQCKKSGIKHPFFSLNVLVTITFRFGWFQSKFIFSFNLPLICFKFFGAQLTAHPVFSKIRW